MNHIDLFSGLGGFAYAAREVWGDEYHTDFFCEINKFCQQVLKKNFGKDILIYDDIKTVTKSRYVADILSRNARQGDVSASGRGQCALKGREAESPGINCRRGHSSLVSSFEHKNIRGNENETEKGIAPDSVISNGRRENSQKLKDEKRQSCDIRRESIQSKNGKACPDDIKQGNATIADTAAKRLHNKEDKQVVEKEGRGEFQSGETRSIQVDLITAGVPCQPASCAGKRKGAGDSRWLWPETFRVIREFKPTWCILENVYGLLSLERGLVFESLCAELEAIGYEVQSFVIPACGVNAPHRRYRVWICAHAKCEGLQEWKKTDISRIQLPERKDCNVADAKNGGVEGLRSGRVEIPSGHEKEALSVCDCKTNAPNTVKFSGRAEPEIESGRQARPAVRECGQAGRREWERDWLEVAIATCDVRVDDGSAIRLDGINLTAAGHRIERLKALGNAIVPQVAMEIFKAIKYAGSELVN